MYYSIYFLSLSLKYFIVEERVHVMHGFRVFTYIISFNDFVPMLYDRE